MIKRKLHFQNTSLVVYVTAFYVLAQFIWWAYLILKQSYEIQLLRSTFEDVNTNKSKIWMVLGEGSIFIVLTVLGFYQIQKALLKEKRLSLQQNNFLLSVTHELKTPLTSNKLMLQTLQKGNIPEDKKVKLLESSIQQIDRLTGLIENILMAAQIENNKYESKIEVVHIKYKIEEIELQLKMIYSTPFKINLDIPDDFTIKTDKIALYSILFNVIENAIKYGGSTPNIFIKIFQRNKTVCIEIADEGIGIKEDQKKEVMKKFYRAGNEETRNTKGTGLGLYIVQKLIESLDGNISIEDNIPQGTRFIISLKNE